MRLRSNFMLGAMLAAQTVTSAGAQTRIPVPDAPDINMVLIPVPEGADVDAALPGVIEKVGAAQGGISQHAKPTRVTVRGLSMRIETVSFNKAPGIGFFFLTVPRGRGICMAAIPLKRAAAVGRPAGAACLDALGGGGAGSAPASSAPSASSAGVEAPLRPRVPARPAASAGPVAHAGNWAKVSGVYFRSLPSFGVGGMMIMKFAPMVLFKDGSFYETDDAALEDVDLAAARAAHPDDWGRWTQQGNRFVLTDAKGRPKDYELQQGNFFKAFPASGPGSLSGDYKTVGGGGNTAMGGEVMIAFQNRYVFRPDGTYANDRATGAMNSGSMSGVASTVGARGGGLGRFTVDRYTITIEQPDGRMERRFFAFGSRKSPPLIDKGMLFIGDTVYTLDD